MGFLRVFREQLERLRRLGQPYFLPYKSTNAYLFLLLIVAMLEVVVGLTLLLLTACVIFFELLSPTLNDRFLPGVADQAILLWASPIGPAIAVLTVMSVGVFITVRGKLTRGRWLPWVMLILSTVLILVINGVNVGISYVARDVDNSLVSYDRVSFWKIVTVYGFCLLVALPIRAIQSYLIPKLGLLWRQWLSHRLLTRYLSNRAYYLLNPNEELITDIDNPDQRISEDIRSFTGTSLSLMVESISAILTFCSFIFVLWSINQSLAFLLLTYSVAGTLVIMAASRRLVVLNYQQLRLEADFRYGLIHIRDNAESIAFYRGEQQEAREAERRLDNAVCNFENLIVWEAMITMIQRSYDYFSRFLPWIVIAPLYFDRQVDFGVFGQSSIAFSQVLFSVSFIVNNVDRLSSFSASITRLEGFQRRLDEIYLEGENKVLQIGPDSTKKTPDWIFLDETDLMPPNSDRLLIKRLSLLADIDRRILVVGPSGSGKTSFLRMVSGLWQPTSGDIQRPKRSSLLFIPQKPYMLLGTLREQLCYPLDAKNFSNEQLRSVLQKVRLGDLVNRYPNLDTTQDWPRLLSLGEQQRLAFGRLLLHSPDFVVLDEVTSALDIDTERHLYQILTKRKMMIISVGHRPTLAEYHDTVLEIQGAGLWRLRSAERYYSCGDYKWRRLNQQHKRKL
uniref:ATPase n=1 Tax=Paulinella chromatophora TaxID=39717 RepID=B1X569_PAUCH|nr:ATPase [Paulinella chromatophora]ACB43088.1 ATPase [Paulinella chromatophora]|eukprot:gb/GEZN01002717.1/.p1 GENE.gb/GEZN01002717.1/~~gb/GEZN01002717.1/.p1  ORF type:complete len:677 (+),score=-38.93 gb/GEZN01002717.1/:294-2324(+)